MNNRGFTLLAAVSLSLVLAILGMGAAAFMATNQVDIMVDIQSKRAFYALQAGIEFAEKKLFVDNVGIQSIVGTYEFGNTAQFQLVDLGGGVVQVIGVDGSARQSYSLSISQAVGNNEASCLLVDVSAASRSVNTLLGIDLSRDAACLGNVVITGATVTWSTDSNYKMTQVDIASAPTEYNDATGVASGMLVNFPSPYIISSAGPRSLTMDWNVDLSVSNIHHFTVDLRLQDNSHKVFTVSFLGSGQAACLSVNQASLALADASGLKANQLTGMGLSNTCGQAIMIDKMTVSWSPINPARQLTSIQMNGAGSQYSGFANSGQLIDIVDLYMAASSSHTVTYIQFSNAMMDREYTIIFTMKDGTTKSITTNIIEDNMAACVGVDPLTPALASNKTDLSLNLLFPPLCNKYVALDRMTLSWSPTTPSTNLTNVSVQVDGEVFSGSNGTGVEANVTDFLVPTTAVSRTIQYFRFNREVQADNRNYTLQMKMVDGTTTLPYGFSFNSNCLTVNTNGAVLANQSRNVAGVILTNTCNGPITITNIQSTWTPNTSRTMLAISIDTSSVWAGTATSTTWVDNTNVIILGNSSKNLDFIQFNGSMVGRMVDVTFRFIDNSEKIAPTMSF